MDAARYHLLKIFKEMERQRSSNDQESQTKWLQLQISCWLGNDPFDVAYRFIRMQFKKEIDQKISVRTAYRELLWAFDEAQQALGDPLASEIMAETLSRNKSNYSHCLLSGTSLELQKMEKFLKANIYVRLENVYGGKSQENYVLDDAKFLKIMGLHAWNIIKELHALQSRMDDQRAPEKFPLLSRGGRALGFTVQLPKGSWEEVEKALQEWHVLKSVTGMDRKHSKEFTDFLKQVMKVHTTLLGRMRWTTLFAEELLRDSPAKKGMLTAQDVENATQRAADRIKCSLRDRIEQFKHTHWVNELYWTAIEADVFSMTRIFSDEESAKLISEGFALVDETEKRSINEGGGVQEIVITKGRLREPLAVKTVMEYLRDPKKGGLYEKLMNRFFTSLQLDRGQGGALGKLAGYVFTAVSVFTISRSRPC
jgi:hypothetical protein